MNSSITFLLGISIDFSLFLGIYPSKFIKSSTFLSIPRSITPSILHVIDSQNAIVIFSLFSLYIIPVKNFKAIKNVGLCLILAKKLHSF